MKLTKKAKKKGKKQKYKCEEHTATIDRASRKTKVCKTATCTLKEGFKVAPVDQVDSVVPVADGADPVATDDAKNCKIHTKKRKCEKNGCAWARAEGAKWKSCATLEPTPAPTPAPTATPTAPPM